MSNMVRKSITVLLISLMIAAGSMSVSAADIAESLTVQAESAVAAYTGIVIDGSYLDWMYYPHSAIQYDECAKYANGAIYNNGKGYVYGHTVTVMTAHQNQELGGMWRFYMSVNSINHIDLVAALMCVGFDGRLHYAAAADYTANMSDIGNAHKYYIVDADYSGPKENITLDKLMASGQLYGEAYVTRSSSQWDMEYMVDVEMLAQKAGLNNASDVKTISVQFYMLGGQWVTTAGTSTGAVLGIFLCLATVFGAYLYKKKKLWGQNE